MRIDTFKNVLETHGIILKAHTWETLIKEMSTHAKLPSPAVGTDWVKLGEVVQKLYVSSANGVQLGFMKNNKDDLIRAVRFIEARYSNQSAEPPQMYKPMYVAEWHEIIAAIDSARTQKKRGQRPTPHMDQFTEGATSRVGITSLLEGLLEGIRTHRKP